MPFWIALVAIVAVGLTQASAFHLTGSLTVDEPLVAYGIRLPWSRLGDAIVHDNLPLYYVVMKAWTSVLGDSEVALRSFSVLCFGLAIVTLGIATRALVDTETGLMAAVLLAVSGMAQFHAVSARPYTLVCLIAATSFLVVARFATSRETEASKVAGSPPMAAIAVLATLHLLGLLTHPVYGFFVAVLPLAALTLSRRALAMTLAASVLAVAVFLLVWWPVWQRTLGMPTINWMERPGLGALRDTVLGVWGRSKTLLLLLAGVALLAVRRSAARDVVNDRVWQFAVTTVVAVIAVLFVVSQVHPVLNPGRTPMVVLPALCVALAVTFRHARSWVATAAVIAVLAAASSWSAAQARVEDLIPTRESVASVAAAARCGDTLVLGSLAFAEVEYYWHRLRAPECVTRETFPAETRLHPAWLDVPGTLARRDALAEEAAQTAERLAARAGSTVWIFHSRGDRYGREVTEVLESELDRRLTRVESRPLGGTYFDVVSRYAPLSPTTVREGDRDDVDRGARRGGADP